MGMSGTYVAEVPLKASARKHYKRWKSETHLFPVVVGHYVQGVKADGAFVSWNYARDGRHEVFKEKRELDDDKMVVAAKGLEGTVMEQLKVYEVILQFIPVSEEGCIGKITMKWEKLNEDSLEPVNYMNFAKGLVADMDGHILKVQAE